MSDAPPAVHVVVLAAGKGTRMKATRPKVLHELGGRTLLDWVLTLADTLTPVTTTVVIGHGAEPVEEQIARRKGVQFVVQEPQLGTGHAVLQTRDVLDGRPGTLVLLSGDVPLLRPDTVARLLNQHVTRAAAATVLTAVVDRPFGYGRIVRHDGRILRIVEERDASPEQRTIREINSGVYAFDLAPLYETLATLGSSNTQGEYYLPDLVSVYRRRGLAVETVLLEDATEIRGVNSQRELAELGAIVRHARNEELMAAGVTIIDPATTYVDASVEVGPDTILHPNVFLEGRTRIGSACEIHAGARIVDSTIEDGVTILNYCVIEASSIAAGAVVGPFARLRPASDVRARAKVGNFVELKKTILGEDSKANHLSYLGDATIGANVNIGAGTITCNYDGVAKHPTRIGDGVFVGSDSQLVAPVSIGEGAYVAAGSSVTEDVPAGALAIARARQVNKAGWVDDKKSATGAGKPAGDPHR